MSKKQIELAPGTVVSDEYLSRSVRYPLINDELSNLLGQVLTVIDASVTEPTQLKAIKDLIKARFSEKIHATFWDYCYRGAFQTIIDADTYLRSMIVDGTAKHSEMDYVRPATSPRPPLD
jgi:hypothetical protein